MPDSATTFPAAAQAACLGGLRVLDFGTLLPGPLASLVLAEAGADVIKVERPGTGDEMRGYSSRFGDASANFALLNRGKRTLVADLKQPGELERVIALAAGADVLIEQFRPGVMDRLGLGYDALRKHNRRLIYCSITGYGQTGAQAAKAGHDLNYLAETGLLGLNAMADAAPTLPCVLAADIAGGAYPAVMNILLALWGRQATGCGRHLDISMADNLYTLAYWGLAQGFAEGNWPRPGKELVTGGSPRYRIYRTADRRFVAAAPIEQRFWDRFCEGIGLVGALRDDRDDPEATGRAVAERIGARDAAEWQRRFAGLDCCVSVVTTLQEAVNGPAFRERHLFERCVESGEGRRIPALPVPLDSGLHSGPAVAGFPSLDSTAEAVTWKKT